MTSRGAPQSNQRRRTYGPKQKTLWWNRASVPATVTANGTAVFDLTPLVGLPASVEGGFTCRRMLTSWHIRPVSTGLNAFGAFGVLVAPRSASSNLPNPIVDLVDWYLLHHWWVRAGEVNQIFPFEFDIRTNRKVRGEDRSLFGILASSAASLTSVEYTSHFRLVLGYP